jgi:hypothetical protein
MFFVPVVPVCQHAHLIPIGVSCGRDICTKFRHYLKLKLESLLIEYYITVMLDSVVDSCCCMAFRHFVARSVKC